MRRAIHLFVVAAIGIAGCGPTTPVGTPAAPPMTSSAAGPAISPAPAKAVVSDASEPAVAESEKATAAAGETAIGPDNTKIEFIGTHVGAKPDPRVGSFGKFSGKMAVDAATKTLKSVNVEIDASSLTTQFQKLTDHLKSADFLEVREYPTITFESTKIEGEAGAQQITGKLTLHGVTKEITIPATVDVVDGAPELKSEFSIDRTEYGINFGPQQVENKVSLTVAVGRQKP